ncbi:MAG: ParB/RepB/Spo0J family partition protein [Mycoplasmatales bacterium]
MAKNSLGKGLEHLFDENALDQNIDNSGLEEILIKDIKPNPYQPRKKFDKEALQELSDSIKEQGVVQPILLRKSPVGYEIIAGERRYRASKLANLDTIPAIIYDYTDKQMMEVAIIENIQREDLSIIEEANSYQMLINNLGITQQELSDKVGKSRSHITNILRLLKLDKSVIEKLDSNLITMGHAKVLVTIDDIKKQKEIVKDIIEGNLTVREVEDIASDTKSIQTGSKPKVSAQQTTNEYKRLEKILRERFQTKVKISGKSKGNINIEFANRDELERILEAMNLLN